MDKKIYNCEMWLIIIFEIIYLIWLPNIPMAISLGFVFGLWFSKLIEEKLDEIK